MRNFIILFITSVVVAGCASPEQRAARLQAEMEHVMRVYGPACARLGYAANTDGWRNCLLQLSTKDEIQRYSNNFGAYPYYYGRPYWGPYW
jgi:hypothetical protein